MPASALRVTPAPAQPPYRPLTLAALIAMLGHAVLIWGLPRLDSPVISGLRSEALETRLISAPAADTAQSAFEPVQAPVPEPPPAPPPAPAPAPAPSPSPAPEAPVVEAVSPPEPELPPTEATQGDATPARASLRSLSEHPSLIEGVPKVTFGGNRGAEPIKPMLTGRQTQSVLAQLQQAIDGQARMPRPANLVYSTRYLRDGSEIPGRTTLSWRQDARYFEADWVENNVKLGNRSYRSRGVVAPQGLAPVHGLSDTQQRDLFHLDHLAHKATITREGAPAIEVALGEGTQDRISAIVHLGALIGGQPERFTPGTRVIVPVLLRDRVMPWTFVVEDTEPVQALSNQAVPSVRLVFDAASAAALQHEAGAAEAALSDPVMGGRLPHDTAMPASPALAQGAQDPHRIQRMDLWLGPTLDFLPVRWRIEYADGLVADHVLQRAVEQTVLSSLPPPYDALPDATTRGRQAAPAARPVSMPEAGGA